MKERLIFIVDGYNVIGHASSRFSFLNEMTLRQQRKWLFENLKKFTEGNIFGIFPNEVFLIFDGISFDEKVKEEIKVVFTGEESADDRIVNIIESFKRKRGIKKILLVTSDRELLERAKKLEKRRLIVTSVASSQFIDWLGTTG